MTTSARHSAATRTLRARVVWYSSEPLRLHALRGRQALRQLGAPPGKASHGHGIPQRRRDAHLQSVGVHQARRLLVTFWPAHKGARPPLEPAQGAEPNTKTAADGALIDPPGASPRGLGRY